MKNLDNYISVKIFITEERIFMYDDNNNMTFLQCKEAIKDFIINGNLHTILLSLPLFNTNAPIVYNGVEFLKKTKDDIRQSCLDF